MQADQQISLTSEYDIESDQDIEVENVVPEDEALNNIDHRSSSSFSGLKRFCETRWSCLYQLTDCHIENYGIIK